MPIEAWADQVSATCNVLPMDAATFRLRARLMDRQSNTVYEDAMIAASAPVHKLTVVTRNVRDFERVDLPVFNPFGKWVCRSAQACHAGVVAAFSPNVGHGAQQYAPRDTLRHN